MAGMRGVRSSRLREARESLAAMVDGDARGMAATTCALIAGQRQHRDVSRKLHQSSAQWREKVEAPPVAGPAPSPLESRGTTLLNGKKKCFTPRPLCFLPPFTPTFSHSHPLPSFTMGFTDFVSDTGLTRKLRLGFFTLI